MRRMTSTSLRVIYSCATFAKSPRKSGSGWNGEQKEDEEETERRGVWGGGGT